MGLFIGLIVVGAIIWLFSRMGGAFGLFLEGLSGKLAVSAVIIGLASIIINAFIWASAIFGFLAKLSFVVAIVLVVIQLITNIFKR